MISIKIKTMAMSMATFLIIVFSISLINTTESEAYSGNSYEEITHWCSNPSKKIWRCNYGSTGCDIENQPLCPGEGT